MAENSARDKIRSAVFSGKKFKTKTIKIFGSKVEIRQPSVGQLMAMEQSDNRQEALISMMVNYCYVPGTNEKVFEKQDKASLLELPVGSWLNDFNEALTEMSGLNVEEAEKNLGSSEGEQRSTA